MDEPASPVTPFREVYQPFLAELAREGRKLTTIARYHQVRWLVTLIGFASTISGVIDVADREHPAAFG
jgi:hypothetical protein